MAGSNVFEVPHAVYVGHGETEVRAAGDAMSLLGDEACSNPATRHPSPHPTPPHSIADTACLALDGVAAMWHCMSGAGMCGTHTRCRVLSVFVGYLNSSSVNNTHPQPNTNRA